MSGSTTAYLRWRSRHSVRPTGLCVASGTRAVGGLVEQERGGAGVGGGAGEESAFERGDERRPVAAIFTDRAATRATVRPP
jgi:hypothetical protein